MNQLSSPAETAAPIVDITRDAMVAAIRTTLGAAVVDTLVKPGDDIWVRVGVVKDLCQLMHHPVRQ